MDLVRSDRLEGRRGCLERADGLGGGDNGTVRWIKYVISMVGASIEDLDGKGRVEVFGKAVSAFCYVLRLYP